MRKMNVWIAAVAAGVMITGCGQSTVQDTTAAVSVQKTETDEIIEIESSETEAAEAGETEAASDVRPSESKEAGAETEAPAETQTEAGTAEQAEVSGNQETAGEYEDNFAVDSAASADFARQIQAAVAEKDLEKLADLTAFPVYVGFPGDSGSVDSRGEFIALGADKIFTPELTASVAAADPDSLSPSMAGFVLSDGSTANIIFSVRDGMLAVSGINY